MVSACLDSIGLAMEFSPCRRQRFSISDHSPLNVLEGSYEREQYGHCDKSSKMARDHTDSCIDIGD